MKHLKLYKESVEFSEIDYIKPLIMFIENNSPEKFKILFDASDLNFRSSNYVLYNKIVNTGNVHFFNHFESSHFDGIENFKMNDIWHKEIKLNFLSKFNDLETIEISHCNIVDNLDLANLNKLDKLEIKYCDMKKITLKHFSKLNFLYLSGNDLTSLEFEEFFPLLKNVRVTHNQIETIKGIENLPELEKFYLTSNSLKNLDFLTDSISTLPNKIKTLVVGENELENINGVGACTDLEFLNCSSNDLKKLKGIERCKKMTKLVCNNNELENLDELYSLENIEILYCSENNIKSLEPIIHFDNSIKLEFDDNPIVEEFKDEMDKFKGEAFMEFLQSVYSKSSD